MFISKTLFSGTLSSNHISEFMFYFYSLDMRQGHTIGLLEMNSYA